MIELPTVKRRIIIIVFTGRLTLHEDKPFAYVDLSWSSLQNSPLDALLVYYASVVLAKLLKQLPELDDSCEK